MPAKAWRSRCHANRRCDGPLPPRGPTSRPSPSRAAQPRRAGGESAKATPTGSIRSRAGPFPSRRNRAARRCPARDHGQMPVTAVRHQPERLQGGRLGRDGAGVLGHDLGERRGLRLPVDHVALGEDAGQAAVVGDQGGADAPVPHGAGRVVDARRGRQFQELAACGHDVRDIRRCMIPVPRLTGWHRSMNRQVP